MSYKIALASSDGKYIDQHFGHADKFLIVDVGSTGYALAEMRGCEPACNGGEHEQEAFNKIAELLIDCEAVFVSRIGRPAAQAMFVKGIRVFEAPYFIEDVLNRIVEENLLDGTPSVTA